ncbi:hypothetical protein M569_17321 [Genlisea aurea]|uniref:Uncharacterized protein n=1 Tax=Genlisea aurea TaxID=192259 RepID=S8BZA6_9LAMI|nr:hypothetical protein M569_17321 [Genlisea aurea]
MRDATTEREKNKNLKQEFIALRDSNSTTRDNLADTDETVALQTEEIESLKCKLAEQAEQSDNLNSALTLQMREANIAKNELAELKKNMEAALEGHSHKYPSQALKVHQVICHPRGHKHQILKDLLHPRGHTHKTHMCAHKLYQEYLATSHHNSLMQFP